MSQPDLAPGVATRLAAAQILYSVFKTRRSLEECLAAQENFAGLEPSDQGFARAMMTEALRQGGRIEAGLGDFLSRPWSEIGLELRALLWIGGAQLWCLDTAAHAAVGETVAAAKAWPQARKASGLVNAVLRRGAEDRGPFDALPPDRIWPDWLREDFARSLGQVGLKALAEAQAERPLLHLTAVDPKATANALGGEEIVPGSVAVDMSRVDALEGYGEGGWWVQDAAAALAARVLAPKDTDLVFDLCAAPGGKTLQLAATGARIIAVDRSRARLTRLQENLERTRLGDSVTVVAADVERWTPPEKAEAILLDAPCSALGTLRRHPEGAWTKSSAEIAGYPAVQAAFLRAAATMLKPGGRLVYCVCTPRREEGLDVIKAVLANGGLVRDPIMPRECAGFEGCLTDTGDLLTIPFGDARHDAFFISRLRTPA